MKTEFAPNGLNSQMATVKNGDECWQNEMPKRGKVEEIQWKGTKTRQNRPMPAENTEKLWGELSL
jgi:hypothetical protein